MIFSAPGNLSDFQSDDQRSTWSNYIDGLFNDVITMITPCSSGSPQFVNPNVRDISTFAAAPVKWPGFPLSLLSTMSKPDAYVLLDQNSGKARDAMDEYLEWYVSFDENGEIVAVDFTTETEFYWTKLYEMSADLAAQKYCQTLGTMVGVADISTGGVYDPNNKYNTTDGIMHLIQRSNELGAELNIAANATIWRTDASGNATTDVVNCFICGTGGAMGDPTRNSDPLIAASVNALARQGRAISIPDPVGLYIDGLNTAGWTTPDGSDINQCWRFVRGTPAVRARFEVPGHAFKISEITIGGDAIKHAGQIAEHVMVTLSAAMGPVNEFQSVTPIGCTSGGPATVASTDDSQPTADSTSDIPSRVIA